MTNAVQTIRTFCELMGARDAEAFRGYFTEQSIYQNVGMPASVGADAIVENLAGQFAMFPDSYAYDIVNIAADGDVVLTERIDWISGPTGKAGIPVMGTFVLRGGTISRWTDYWDTTLPMKFMTGEDTSALVPATA